MQNRFLATPTTFSYRTQSLEHPSHLGVRHLNKALTLQAELGKPNVTKVIAELPFSMTSFARSQIADKVREEYKKN